MKGERLELWQTLCAQAAVEQDPKKLMELVKEIDRLLSEKQDRLNREREPLTKQAMPGAVEEG